MLLAKEADWLVLQWLQEANSSNFHRNVHFVCGDGTTVAWSGLFLASPSLPALQQALQGLDQCSFCPGNVATILLKYFRYLGPLP